MSPLSREFNELKKLSLRAFHQEGWLRPPEWAVLVRFWPVRASYSYLLHLYRMGLLNRKGEGERGMLRYSLSPKGRHKLRWLTSQE